MNDKVISTLDKYLEHNAPIRSGKTLYTAIAIANSSLKEWNKVVAELQAEIDESEDYLGDVEYLAALYKAMTIIEKHLGGTRL